MTSVTEHRVPATDLHRVVVACPTCHGELALDLAEEKQRPIFRVKETDASLVCPLCKQRFPYEVREAISRLWDFYEVVVKDGVSVTFRVAGQ